MQEIIIFLQSHAQLSTAFLITLAAVLVLEFIRARKQTPYFSPAQATQWINRQQAVIIDIRSADAFTQQHIIDAISFPAENITTAPKKLAAYEKRPLIIMCETGTAASAAAKTLKTYGFQAYILEGGLKAWIEGGLPTLKG